MSFGSGLLAAVSSGTFRLGAGNPDHGCDLTLRDSEA